ncbi:MAG: hypothetical protein ACPGUC_10910, partial [Gammaproteobacteria bacterium]
RCDQPITSALLDSYTANSTFSATKDGLTVRATTDIPPSLLGEYGLCMNNLSDPTRAYAMDLNADGSGQFHYFGKRSSPRYPFRWGVLLGDGTEVPEGCHAVTHYQTNHSPPRDFPAYVLLYTDEADGGNWRYTFLIDLDGKPVVPGPSNSALSQRRCPGR